MTPDSQTNANDTDYFFLGNGAVMAAIQWSRNPELTPLGIILGDPERLSRKEASYLHHPEAGLRHTMLQVIIDGILYLPTHDNLHVEWILQNQPCIRATWVAGNATVTETFTVDETSASLIRHIALTIPQQENVPPPSVMFCATLYANNYIFDGFGNLPEQGLFATGYRTLTLASNPAGDCFERFLTVTPANGATTTNTTYTYTLGAVGSSVPVFPVVFQRLPGSTPLAPVNNFPSRIMRQFQISAVGLRAAVSASGKFDACLWQYNFEWGMDAAMVAIAATYSGNFPLAQSVLTNILTRLSNSQGMVAESSRFRDGELSELNANGAVLDALWRYRQWTGDAGFIAEHWERIVVIAEYPLRAEYVHNSGLLQGRRDIWERLPWMGIQSGFDISHQTLCSVGLAGAAALAEDQGETGLSTTWGTAAERMREALVSDPMYSLVENDVVIHRRLMDGSVQHAMTAEASYHDRRYQPYVPLEAASTTLRACVPDASSVLPIIYRVIHPTSDIARKTLTALQALWDTDGQGGYARSPVESEPDSPGPWPFATAWIAAAELDAGMHERATRSINWLLDSAGAGGSWLEYYGPRKTPPYPPVGVIVWGWAQYIVLVTQHMFGVCTEQNQICIRPAITGLHHTFNFCDHSITIAIHGFACAVLNGERVPDFDGTICIPLPLHQDYSLEFTA